MAAVGLAVGVVAGATLARPVPGPVLAALAVGLVRWRRPVALVLLAAALASTWGAAAHRGLAPAPAGRHHGWVTLLTDPSPVASGVQVEVRLGRRHVEAWARGGASGSLRARLSGEQVLVTGRLRPLTDPGAWQVARHLSGRLEIDVVEGWRPGTPPVQAANRLHRLLARGAADLPDDTRALFLGFVLGDDRGRSELVTDDFRGAGLMHLLAVSGQNVAFVLALFAPALRRLGLRSRFVATLALLAFFALLTRFEPSVLRATAMAAIATLAATRGREATSLRVLSLAVAGLVLVDPLLVVSVGFRLSVAASLGIVALAGPLERALPGPRPLAEALSVGLGAQLGVAPVLLSTFGDLPVVAPAANLLAVPAAGPLTTWGMTAGLLAGAVPAVADLVHLPTRLLVGWVAGVARVAVGVPLGQLGATELVAAVAGGGAVTVGRRRHRSALVAGGVVLLVGALVLPGLVLRLGTPPPHGRPADGADLWRGGGRVVLVLSGRVDEGDLLAGLRTAGVARLDLVVCRSDSGALAPVVADLRRRYGAPIVVAPDGSPVPGAVAPPDGTRVGLGDVGLVVREVDGGLEVHPDAAGGGGGGSV